MQNPELHAELSRVIESAIARKATQTYRWREDHITLSWLEDLQDSDVLSRPRIGSLYVELAAWKLSGRAETGLGDVAVLARIRYPETSSHYEAGAFLEAKRSDPAAPFRYSYFDERQYLRVAGSLAHRYLFYRREPFATPEDSELQYAIALEDAGEAALAKFLKRPRGVSTGPFAEAEPGLAGPNRTGLGRASAVPSYLLGCFRKPLGDGAFSAGVALATQIHRYCHGWDLGPMPPPDHGLQVPDDVPFILTLTAAHGGLEPPQACPVPEGYERVRSQPDSDPDKRGRGHGGNENMGFG